LGYGLCLYLIAVSGGNSGLLAAGFYCVIAGCIGTVAATIPGTLDWLMVVPPNSSAKSRGLLHGSLNVLGLLLFIYVAYRLGGPSAQPDRLTLFLMANRTKKAA
jgi:hypothetical protein